jgi:hypothetical protein
MLTSHQQIKPGGDKMLTKLKKNQLKRLFTENNGTEFKEIIIVPCKMNPESMWAPKHGIQLTRTGNDLYVEGELEDTPLDTYLNEFTAHSCNNEMGYYPAFYVKEATK